MSVNDTGLTIYGARERIARCEVMTNSVFSMQPVSFSIKSMSTFVRILQSAKDIHQDDFSDFKFIVDLPAVRLSSKKFKMKLQCCTDDIIEPWISKKVETELKPVFEFTTTSDLIKRVNSHQFIFSNPNEIRIYLETHEEMENNALFATIGNRSNNLNNEMTLKFGIVTFGKLDRVLTLDQQRLNLFNSVQSNEIKVQLMDKGCIVSKTQVCGKNGSVFSMIVYNTLIKN